MLGLSWRPLPDAKIRGRRVYEWEWARCCVIWRFVKISFLYTLICYVWNAKPYYSSFILNWLHRNWPTSGSTLADPGGPQKMVIKYLSVGQIIWFIYQQIALDVLFQMRYDSLPNSNKQSSDSLKAEATPVFTSKQDCFAYCFAQSGVWGLQASLFI